MGTFCREGLWCVTYHMDSFSNTHLNIVVPGVVTRELYLLINQNDTIENLFEVRMVLETAAAGWAAKRCTTGKERHRIAEFIKESQNLLNQESIDSRRYHENDQNFHLLVAEISDNPVVVRLMKNIIDLFDETRKRTNSIPGRVNLSVQEHIEILEAIYKGRVDEASKAMHNHLDSVLKSIKKAGSNSLKR